MKRCISSGWRSERGQALAEFALVLPLILFFIAGILEFGRAWNIKQAITDAAREGARYAVVQDLNITSTDDVKAKIEERLALSGIDTADIQFSGSFHVANEETTVSISTPLRMGLVGVLLGWAGAPSTVNISTQATMRSEWGN
jgi:Flp pilus assembly protein TadG